nr:HAMP domain-containing protein [Lachnospiraceae bacterium]
MRRTLYLKFILAYLIFGFFGFVVVATFVSSMTSEHLIKTKSESLYEEATIVANTYAVDLYNNEIALDTVKRQVDALSAYSGGIIWIINPSGRLILSSNAPISVNKEVIVEGFDPASTGNSYYIVGTFFDYFKDDYLSVFAPITSGYKIKGYVVIHYPKSALNKERESLLTIDYLLLVILFLLSLIILIFFTEMVYLPLRKITEATEQYASGNMHYELQMDSDDEIGYLGATLAYMAQESARADDDQKKFVANVSHDFRSPLTSIRGYLEAMLDGTIPPESHEKYLGIVLNETERLTKLTNGLLTLNNLNTSGMLLDISVFDINEVIRSVAATFEGTCKKKVIAVELIFSGDQLYVKADCDKIKQVLYNLVDNAIKFSHPDSVIKIETSEKHNKVFVSVKDSG